MNEHLERRGIRKILGLGLALSVSLACAAKARAQSGEPPAGADAAGAGAAAEPPPLADDSAAPASDPAGEEAPWSRGVDVDRRRAARALFLEANGLARKRFFATAAAKFKQAIDLWPHPAFSYNLALAQFQLDQPIEAHASLVRAIEHGPAPLGDRYDQARQQIARIESEIGTIEVSCAEPGARLMLDGKLVFTGPDTYRGVVRPGAHQLVAMRRGLTPVVEQIAISPGERGRFALTFEYPEVEVTVSTRRWAAWKSHAVAGAGVALLLAGGALDWHSTRVFDQYDRDFREACGADCGSGLTIDGLGALRDLRDRGRSEQRAASITNAVGGTALVTGAVLTYLGRERTSRRRVRMAPDPEPGIESIAATSAIEPILAPGVIGVSAGFCF